MKIKFTRNKLYIVTINVIILFLILVGLETFALAGRFIFKKSYKGFILNLGLNDYLKILNDPCNRMVTHPILGHTHEINDDCKVLNGKIIGPYVIYKNGEDKKDIILTLGGSTTDGFYNHINNGLTWSTKLSILLNQGSYNYGVVNGGIGGYDSSNELIKLLLDLPRFKREKNVKYVISLNGINELPGYRNRDLSNNELDFYYFAYKLPLWNSLNIKTLSKRKFISQAAPLKFELFPSTMSFIQWLGKNKSTTSLIKRAENDWLKHFNLPFGDFKNSDIYIEAANQWEYNVKNMHVIASNAGAKYFVFLQPTLGLFPNQIPTNKNSNDYKIMGKKSDTYYQNLNRLYSQLIPRCKKLEFCIDISSEVTPEGNVYNDPRHHNENGNNKLGQLIFENLEYYLEKN